MRHIPPGKLFPPFEESYLNRLTLDLQIDYLCADHYGYIVGEEAGEYVARSAEAARQFRVLIEETYHSTKDTDAVARTLTTLFYTEHPDYFLSPEIFQDVHRQMARHIVGVMEGKG